MAKGEQRGNREAKKPKKPKKPKKEKPKNPAPSLPFASPGKAVHPQYHGGKRDN